MYKLFIKENIDSHEFLSEVLKSVNITNYKIIYNEFGKPYLVNNPIYFSISHDKNVCVIAISNKNIGIDIEALTYRSSVTSKYFNESEQTKLMNSNNKEYDFTKIWVMKESYIKMLGIGLEYGLKNVDTFKIKNMIDIKRYKNYLISICRGE